MVQSAIDKAMLYGAFDCATVRNICRQEEGTFPSVSNQGEIAGMSLTQKTSLLSESVEERSLNYYSQLEG